MHHLVYFQVIEHLGHFILQGKCKIFALATLTHVAVPASIVANHFAYHIFCGHVTIVTNTKNVLEWLLIGHSRAS